MYRKKAYSRCKERMFRPGIPFVFTIKIIIRKGCTSAKIDIDGTTILEKLRNDEDTVRNTVLSLV